jgi:hypothetical protein
MKCVTSTMGHPAGADALDQRPGVAPGLRVEAGGQLVEHGHLRAPGQRQRDRERLLLAAGQLAVPGAALPGQLAVPGAALPGQP